MATSTAIRFLQAAFPNGFYGDQSYTPPLVVRKVSRPTATRAAAPSFDPASPTVIAAAEKMLKRSQENLQRIEEEAEAPAGSLIANALKRAIEVYTEQLRRAVKGSPDEKQLQKLIDNTQSELAELEAGDNDEQAGETQRQSRRAPRSAPKLSPQLSFSHSPDVVDDPHGLLANAEKRAEAFAKRH